MAHGGDGLDSLGLSEATRRLLTPNAAPLEAPVRSVLFGPARFREHGTSLARAQQVAPQRAWGATFFPRLHDNLAMLREARALLEEHALQGHHLEPAAGWLIDNGTLIDQQLDTVRQDLPRRFFARLPRLAVAPLAGLPRIYGVAWSWVAHTDSGLDEELLRAYLAAYQDECVLSLAELWALPTTLRVVLIENLRRLAERAATQQAARDAAHRWIELPPERRGWQRLDRLGDSTQRRGVFEAFALQLVRRSNELPYETATRLREWLAARLPDAASALQQQHQQVAEDHHSVRNAITALRLLDRVDWRSLFMASSPVMRELERLPVFAAEADRTQDQALAAIEKAARRCDRSELDVARAVATLAGDAQGVGGAPLHWLDGGGHAELWRALARDDLARRDERRAAWRRAATPGYIALVAAGTLGLVGCALAGSAAPLWQRFVAALLLAAPASQAIVATLNRLISESVLPRALPRLALPDGIPAGRRVLVVVPALLTGEAAIAGLVAQLEQHHLANPERHAQFALLSDWVDAPERKLDADAALLEAARAAIERLNARHPAPAGEAARFLLLHRERVWSDSEQRWIGWERKRGKLEQLACWLVEGGASPFVELGTLARPAAGIESIVTLDSDTDMPPGRLRELIGIAQHPLVVPVVDAAQGRVVAGYGVLQPRLETPLPSPGSVTPFYWLFSGRWGIDPYSAASSEVYQDVFGAGSFAGKGVLNVAAVHATLVHRLPAAQVLSHDLLEGAIARCGAVSDVTLVEDSPAHPDVAASRLHRWTRGDWQLLPFIAHPAVWRMAAIDRWKMIDNLRRSLVAPLSLVLVVWALCVPVVPITTVLAMIAAAYGAGSLLGAIAGLAPHRDDLALGIYFRHALAEVLRAVASTLWQALQLFEQALLSVDAITRALLRQFVTRRRLLEWTTAAAAHAAARADLASLVRTHARTSLASLALLGALWLASRDGIAVDLRWGVPLMLAWGATPLWIWAASRHLAGPAEALDDAQRTHLRELAHATWRYYECHVGAEDHGLPPDNVQSVPHLLVAHRTSPTNIGIYLLCTAVARELGFIACGEMVSRFEATLATLERLPRHAGHFYNWYDTRTLTVLAPAYVSAVDSGNLSAHLLLSAVACEEAALALRAADDPLRARLDSLAARCRAFALEADYRVLYDMRRGLLRIGLRVDADEPDDNHYDLLASEARLTSLVAIAKGDLPASHWAELGRPLFAGKGGPGLKSWSGSMFEYLMPTLVLDEPAGSLLRQATRSAIEEQRDEAASHGTPWGISESAIAVQDQTLAYQYGPQGVPNLALRRTPADERVIAPYASMMALMVAPRAAFANLLALEGLGVRRELGFIEALDYTPSRQPTDGPRLPGGYTPVQTFMAHHQGMSLLACAHVLADGVVHRWMRAEPYLRAVRVLLHERVPHEIPASRRRPAAPVAAPPPPARWQCASAPLDEGLPPTQLLGNGRYAVVLRANGAGYSEWQGAGLTRWRDDALRDGHGWFGYLRRGGSERWVSLAARPAPDALAEYVTEFHPDRAVLHARWPDLEATTTISVSTEDDCELRRVELHNTGDRPLQLQLAMAFEVTLAEQRADEAHPAFSNLFVQAQWSAADQAMYLERRPRLPGEASVHAVHFLASANGPVERIETCADRARWIGRLGSAARPLGALQRARPGAVEAETTTLDTGLDPMSVIAVRLMLPPGATRTLTFALAAASDPEVLRALVDRHRQPAWPQRALGLSDTLARIHLREWRVQPDGWAAWLYLNSLIVGGTARAPSTECDRVDRRLLWRHAISGDRPIVAVWVESADGIAMVRQMVGLLPLWTAAGLALDLIIVNAEAPSYEAPVQQALVPLASQAQLQLDPQVPEARRATLRLLQARDLVPAEQATLRRLARVMLNADRRPLGQHMDRVRAARDADLAERRQIPAHRVAGPAPMPLAGAPAGDFDAADAAYRFVVSTTRYPQRPWINVLANPDFGCQVSEAGAGFTWAGNSRLQQITGWSNDALCDRAGEAVLLEDLDTHRVWVLGRSLEATDREVVHGIGYTRMQQTIDGIAVTLEWCVDAQASIKQLVVTLVARRGGPARNLRLVGFAEWTLGGAATDRVTLYTQAHRWGSGSFALMATQLDAAVGDAGATAFLGWRRIDGAAEETDDWTCDRQELYDTGGMAVLPERLRQRAGAGLDACATLACRVPLAPGQTASMALLLGHAPSADGARQLARQAWAVAPAERLAAQRGLWPALLDGVTVRTPDARFDALVNRWLPYQAIACRLWARAGFYQAGGAFGFRDQLQDAMSLVARAPQLLRRQILLHAAHQFTEGDVQHWWHMPGGAGVRTHISDDFVWLPYAVAHYVHRSGDASLLDERATFLQGPPVPEGREDLYDTFASTPDGETIYEHAARALDHALRVGSHGLPLMGTGDWNDGMNRVGCQGRGESIWLAWFVCATIDDYAPLAERRGDAARVQRWRLARAALAAALDEHGWDGRWYRRAYFDDGSPLGSASNTECRIDLIAQAWAVLSDAGDPQRAREAMGSAAELLWDAHVGVMRLLDPPLADAQPSAGYIQAYPPGVRENGGQYNHGAVWALMAFAELGQADWAWRVFEALSPAHRAADSARGSVYGLEPYVAAGDIYSHAPYAGRGGWSWYTGSAAWLQRAALESICGVVVEGATLRLRPCLPPAWAQAEVTLRREGRTHRFTVCRDAAAARSCIVRHAGLERLQAGASLDLDALRDGSHHMLVVAAGEQRAPARVEPARRAGNARGGVRG